MTLTRVSTWQAHLFLVCLPGPCLFLTLTLALTSLVVVVVVVIVIVIVIVIIFFEFYQQDEHI